MNSLADERAQTQTASGDRRFAQIPFFILERRDIGAADKVTYLALRRFLDFQTGVGFAGRKELADASGVKSTRSVDASINRLVDLGLLQRIYEYRLDGKYQSEVVTSTQGRCRFRLQITATPLSTSDKFGSLAERQKPLIAAAKAKAGRREPPLRMQATAETLQHSTQKPHLPRADLYTGGSADSCAGGSAESCSPIDPLSLDPVDQIQKKIAAASGAGVKKLDEEKAKRKPLPYDWYPNGNHSRAAEGSGWNVDELARLFRYEARRQGKTSANWDGWFGELIKVLVHEDSDLRDERFWWLAGLWSDESFDCDGDEYWYEDDRFRIAVSEVDSSNCSDCGNKLRSFENILCRDCTVGAIASIKAMKPPLVSTATTPAPQLNYQNEF